MIQQKDNDIDNLNDKIQQLIVENDNLQNMLNEIKDDFMIIKNDNDSMRNAEDQFIKRQ